MTTPPQLHHVVGYDQARAMGWGRGVFRVWVLVAAAWVLLAMFLRTEAQSSFYSGLAGYRFMIVPPLVIGAAMAFLVWVASGFRRSS